jgi:hypothetical protein
MLVFQTDPALLTFTSSRLVHLLSLSSFEQQQIQTPLHMSDTETDESYDSDETDASPEELAARVAHRPELKPLPEVEIYIDRTKLNNMIRAKKAWRKAKVSGR